MFSPSVYDATGEDEIVHLNVGGTKMATKKSTLCQVEESMLATMFSGRWETDIERDEDGHVFLDYNPELFALVLDYLRAKKFQTPGKPALLPPVALEDVVNFKSLVDYLGVVPHNQNTTDVRCKSLDNNNTHRFLLYSEGMMLNDNGTTATHTTGKNSYEYVIGKDEFCPTSGVQWRFCLNSVQPNSNIFVGLLDSRYRDTRVSEFETTRLNYVQVPPVHRWKGSYGWVLGEEFQTCSDGHGLHTDTFGPLGKKDDIIDLHLKTETSDIYTNTHVSLLIQPSGVTRRIPLPNDQVWQCVIGSYNSGDRISLVS